VKAESIISRLARDLHVLGGKIALQNHRMFGIGRDLCGSPSSTPYRSRVTQSRLHRTASRRGLKISREGDSTTSLGNPVLNTDTFPLKALLGVTAEGALTKTNLQPVLVK